MSRSFIFTVVALAVALPTIAMAQSQSKLVGTWKLVSLTSKTDEGQVNNVYGAKPSGFLTYTPDGRMSVVIAEDGRKPLSVNDSVAAPMEERAQAFSTMTAYAGTYTFSGGKVVHHVEVASLPNWVGTDQERIVKMEGQRLTLSTRLSRGGVMQSFEITWERLKPSGLKARTPAH